MTWSYIVLNGFLNQIMNFDPVRLLVINYCLYTRFHPGVSLLIPSDKPEIKLI